MNEDAIILLAGISLSVWLVLEFFRGGFWRADQRLLNDGFLSDWPSVLVVIPARNEAATIDCAIESIYKQKYPNSIHIIVVDDQSADRTADIARNWANLHVLSGKALPKGWTGKLWAIHQGLNYANTKIPEAEFVLMTDADIEHGPDSIRQLVFKAQNEHLHLVSLMVRLRTESFWEKLLIPAFIYFFQKLYPFPWVNDPTSPTAAAAGGCMLIRRKILQNAGGVERIRDQLIDDCAIGRLMKACGPIWLGLTHETRSLRAYESLQDIWKMVARTAFVQLDHSPIALICTVFGMIITYIVPPLGVVYAILTGCSEVFVIGGIAWTIMTLSYLPILKYYDGSAVWAIWLPFVALLYTLMTVSSALRYWQGTGSNWKGRLYSG